MPPNDSDHTPHSVGEVHRELDRLLAARPELGFRNLVADSFLQPRNPFQASRRQPKRTAVAAVGILLLGLLIQAFFHGR